jgi:alkanesulfonate monooxygenase SsuD/methylene tetrahydromethanopterin reductase-like flavin-dependent oxidoreductase (luciferase family)
MAMKFGIFNLMNEYGFTQRDVFEGTIACVKLVEEIGFDVAWFAEHHFSNYSLCPSPLMMAAAVSRETSRIGLGPAVVVAPLYNPIRLSEELALLDQLSHGRAILGIGSGYQRFEFDAFGADLAERQERMLEVWRIVNQAVHSNLFGTHGRMYRMPNVPQAIRLYSPRRIDSFFVSWSKETLDFAVEIEAVPFVTVGWGNSQALLTMREFVEEKYREAGHDLAGRRFAAQRHVFVSDDRAEVRKVAEGIRYVGRCGGHMRVGAQVLDGHQIRDVPLSGEPELETIEASVPIGDPETVAERLINEIRSVGVSDLSCFMWHPGIEIRSALKSIQRFGSEVMPIIRKALARDVRTRAEARS